MLTSSGSSTWNGVKMDHPNLMQLIPGAAQGATQVFLGHPVDTVKTRLQSATTEIGPSAPHTGGRRGPRFQNSGTLSVLAKMAREEGFLSLYRGVTPPLLLTAAKRSLQFALWENLHESFEGSSLVNVAPGAIAGFAGTVVGCPVHVVKIQTQNSRARDTKNAFTCFTDILKAEGIKGLYRGMYAQILKDTCFAAMYLGLYGILREHVAKSRSENMTPPVLVNSGADHSTITSGSMGEGMVVEHSSDWHPFDPSQTRILGTFFAGAVASTCTWVLLAPLDTFKTFVQSKRNPIDLWNNAARNGTADAFRVMWRGLPAAMIRSGPVSGCAMIAYEGSRSFLAIEEESPRVSIV